MRKPTKYFRHGIARSLALFGALFGTSVLLDRLEISAYDTWWGAVIRVAVLVPVFWLTERIFPPRQPRDFLGRPLDGKPGGRYDADTWRGTSA